MRLKAEWWMVAALSLLAACPSGGELREETERRRLEQASLDSVRDSATTDGRLPAFVEESLAVAPPAPDTQAAPPVTGQWTAGVLDMRRDGQIAVVRGVRVARNDGFDRLVIDLGEGSALPGWHTEYVDRPVIQCGSGEPMEIDGDGFLLVRLRTAQAHDDDGRPTVNQREAHFNLPIVREMKLICDFEGDVEIVLGVDTPNPYRVTELQNPSRLVIDVQH